MLCPLLFDLALPYASWAKRLLLRRKCLRNGGGWISCCHCYSNSTGGRLTLRCGRTLQGRPSVVPRGVRRVVGPSRYRSHHRRRMRCRSWSRGCLNRVRVLSRCVSLSEWLLWKLQACETSSCVKLHSKVLSRLVRRWSSMCNSSWPVPSWKTMPAAFIHSDRSCVGNTW